MDYKSQSKCPQGELQIGIGQRWPSWVLILGIGALVGCYAMSSRGRVFVKTKKPMFITHTLPIPVPHSHHLILWLASSQCQISLLFNTPEPCPIVHLHWPAPQTSSTLYSPQCPQSSQCTQSWDQNLRLLQLGAQRGPNVKVSSDLRLIPILGQAARRSWKRYGLSCQGCSVLVREQLQGRKGPLSLK